MQETTLWFCCALGKSWWKDTQVSKFKVNLWISLCVGICFSWYPTMRDTCQFSICGEKGFGGDYTCKEIRLHSGVAYQKRLLPLSDDNQEHLVWAGAYLSPAPSEPLPQLLREMAAFIFLQFFRDLLFDINFSTRLFRKSGELKERSGERALKTWGNSIAGKISSSDLFSLMEV